MPNPINGQPISAAEVAFPRGNSPSATPEKRIGDTAYYGSFRRPDGVTPGEPPGSPLPRLSPPPSGPQNDSSDPAFGIFVALLLSLPLWLEIGCLLGLIR